MAAGAVVEDCCWRLYVVFLAVLFAGQPLGARSYRVLETGLEFVVEPHDVVVVRGETLVWNCSAVSSRGNAPPNITWFRNGRELTDTRRLVLSNGTLVIRKVKGPAGNSDKDVYECMAANEVGVILSRPVLLQIAYLNATSEARQTVTVENNNSLRLWCNIVGRPTPHIVWSRNNTDLQNDTRYVVLMSGVLQIYPLRLTDSGVYQCRGRNVIGSVSGTDVEVTVTTAESGVVKLVAGPSNVTVSTGSQVQLECAISSTRQVSVTWSRTDGVSLPVGRWRMIGRGNLELSDVVSVDSGSYRCQVTGSTVVVTAQLQVQVSPYRMSVSNNRVTSIGSDIEFECIYGGTPLPEMNWVKDGYSVADTGRVRLLDSSLSISAVTPEDSGLYQCWAENDAGMEYSIIRLLVEQGTPQPSPDEGPNPPTGLVAHLVDSRTVELSWDPSPPKRNPTVAYAVHYHSAQLGDLQKVVIENSLTLDQLSPFTNYTFRVVAYNRISASQPSDSISLVTGDDVPAGVPTINAFRNGTSLIVTWDLVPPVLARGRIISHDVIYRRINDDSSPGSPVGVMAMAPLQHTITGLQVDNTYEVLVVPCTSVGCTPWRDREWSWKRVVMSSVPTPPELLHCIAVNESNVLLRWSSHPTTVYTVRYSPTHSPQTLLILTSSSESLLVSGLQPYTEYQFSVYSSDQVAPLYNTARCRTKQSNPSEPLHLEASALRPVSNQDSSIDLAVRWSPPTFTNGVIQSYLLQLSSNSNLPDSLWTPVISNGSTTSIVIYNLNSDPSFYFIKVRAVNGHGVGPPSNMLPVSTTVALGVLRDWEIGVIVGASVGICCIVICVVVLVLLNRCRPQRSASIPVSEPSHHGCDGYVVSTNSSGTTVGSHHGNQRHQDSEMESFLPDTKGVPSQQPARRHGDTILTSSGTDKPKRYVTTSFDESAMPLCADNSTTFISSNPSSPCSARNPSNPCQFDSVDLPTSPSEDVIVAIVTNAVESQDTNDNCCRDDDRPTSSCQTRSCQRTSGSISGSEEVRSGSSMALSGSKTGSPELGSRSREGSRSGSLDFCEDETMLECTDSGIRLNGDSDIDTPTSLRQDTPTDIWVTVPGVMVEATPSPGVKL